MQEMWVRSLGQEMATHFSILIWEIPGQIEFQRYTDGQQAHRKMLNITNHQGNANQNHNEISPHTCQNGYHQKNKQTNKKKKQVLVRIWRKGNAHELFVRMQTGAATVKDSMEDPKKIKNRTTI